MVNIKQAIITPYKYWNMGVEQLVYVVKGQEHPDPFGRLMWGRDTNGEVIPGDYTNHFKKAGKPIKVMYDIAGMHTAMQEKEQQIRAIKAAIKTQQQIAANA